jgi:hypothetical protein
MIQKSGHRFSEKIVLKQKDRPNAAARPHKPIDKNPASNSIPLRPAIVGLIAPRLSGQEIRCGSLYWLSPRSSLA